MKKPIPAKLLLLLTANILFCSQLFSQSTSWKGTSSTSWGNAANWSNGIPTSTTDVVIGDLSFTRLPSVNTSSTCKNLTIQGSGNKLTINKSLTITGNLSIGAGTTVAQGKASMTLQGNWSNSGSYTTSSNSANVIFGGSSQTITGATTFRKFTINTGSTVTLNTNITITNATTINGTLNPNENSTYLVSAAAITVGVAGVLKVNASAFGGNYTYTSLTLSAGSTVDYSSTTVTQTILNTLTYSTLKTSGSGIKQLSANLNALNSTSSTTGNIYVTAGTLDLSGFTANRGTTVAGGTISVSNGATLKIGGTNAFPLNYSTVTLSLTSNTEYNGTAQTVTALTYGNLKLSSSGGAVTKTGPASGFTIAGNFVTSVGSGSGVTFNANSNITVSGNDTIGTSTTFNGSSFSHTVVGNWVNNGTYTPGTSTITMSGPGSTITGSSAQTFNNLTIAASNITAASTTINVAGNLATTGSGAFTHNTGGTLTMSGTSKTISGLNITLADLAVSGTVTTSSSFSVTGNISVAGSLTASAGNITMSGSTKTVSGAGTIGFYGLLLPGSITTSSNFSIANALDVSGSFTASAGTATFTGTSTLNGTANLFNVTLNGTSLILSTNSNLGISNTFTITAGTLNVTTAVPNIVTFNGTGAQTIPGITYYRLILTNGGTKTAGGAITTNGLFQVDASTTFAASSFTHTINQGFTNNGTFTAGTSNMTFAGAADATIRGTNTFNILTVNKNSSSNIVTLADNMNASTVTMTQGQIKTGSTTLNITTTRTGNGIIWGNIKRTHSFTTGTAYEFESPNNSITFASVSGVTSVTVTVTQTSISDFPFGAAINREYSVNIPSGTYNATLRLHYEDAELNGNTESALVLWTYSGATWTNIGQSGLSSTSNYVEKSGITSINTRWTCSNIPAVFRWNGSVSTDWNTAANWTLIQGAGTVPGANDVVQIGQAAFTNQPAITTAASVKNVQFGSVQAATLTLGAGGSLTTAGNISGDWSANTTHTINAGSRSLTVGGSLVLSDGTTGHAINLSMAAATVNVTGSLTQSGGANITISGASALNIGGDFIYSDGTFTAGTSTVTFNGTNAQTIAPVTYYNLVSDKTAGISTISSAATISGNLTVNNGEIDVFANTTVSGNVSVAASAKLRSNSSTLSISGNLSNAGTFIPGSGTISFIGTGSQTISLATFYNIIFNKPSGTAVFTGNIDVYGDLSILQGSIDLGTYTAHRTSQGGTMTLSSGTSLTVGGASNFPANYSTYTLASSSTVTYNGTVAQSVVAAAYGNLVFSNGGTNAKTLTGTTTVNGDITINSGSTFNGDVYNLNLYGNWNNSGTFVPVTGAVLLNGTSKTITGNTTFNKVTVYGSYTVAGSDITYNGWLNITTGASYVAGGGTAIVNGDLTNSGTLTSTGTTTFSGTQVQTIRLLNAISSTSTGVINFNGTIAPVLNSTSTPTFATLNINNTGGINPSVDWTILVGFNISSGATFNGGTSTHNIYGTFANNGTVTSTGTLNFVPTTAKTYTLAGTSFSSTGTVIFGGSGAIIANGAPSTLTNVIISNTAGVTPGTGWTVNNDFVVSSTGVFNAGSNSYTVLGDIESDGTLNGGTSTFTMNGAASELSGSPNTTFYNYTVGAAASVTVISDFNVSHDFTNNNTIDASVGNPVFTGSLAGTITGSAASFTLAQFAVSKTNATVTLAKNLTTVATINVTSGTFDQAALTIAEDAGNGALNVYDNATYKIGGTNALPAFTSYSLDSLSTVEYYGSTQTITSISAVPATYGNLVISSAGTKTANGTLNIRNNFTLTNGTFVTGSYVDTLGGNWNMSSGILTSTGSTITLDGTGTQDISSTGAFNNLIINKTSNNATLSSNITVNGTLTFTLGKIQTGINALIIPSTGSVSGAGQSTGWVYGKLQKNVAIGASVARTFEVGNAASYTPATTTTSLVTTGGNLTVNTTNGDHPNIGTSNINSNKSVNRYWTFLNSGIVFSNSSITVNWVASDLDAGVTTSNFKVGNYASSAWTLPSTNSATSTSIQATGITAFGDVAVGEVFSTANWTGALSTVWGTAGNWSTGAVPIASTSVTIPGSLINYPVLSSGTGTVNNITINSGASVTVSSTLQIGGSITNNGTFTASSGTLEFNGVAAQSIAGSMFASKTIANLTISNAAGVNIASTANDSLIITGTISFGNVNNSTLNTGNNLTLRSNASGTARIADITNAGVNSGNSITGNATVERYIKLRAGGTGRAYRLLAPTVNTTSSIKANWMEGQMNTAIGTNVNNFPGYGTQITGPGGNANGFDVTQSNAASLYLTGNAVTPTYSAVGSTSGTLNAKTGYFLFIRGDRSANMTLANTTGMPTSATTLRATGSLLQGTQSSFTNAFSSASGTLNLVTNPFASPIDWNAIYTDASTTNLSNYYTYWDANVGTRGGFVTVTNTGTVSPAPSGGVPAGTTTIQPGQAFFVTSTGAGTPTLSIKEIHKTAGNNNNVFRITNSPVSLAATLYFTEPNGYRRVADGVTAMFDNSFSNGLDGNDAIEINNWDENIAINRSGKHLSIESRTTPSTNDTLPIFMNNMKQRDYELQVDPKNLVLNNMKAELIDNYLNKRSLLSQTDSTVISFTVNSDAGSSANDRFMIVFSPLAPLAIDVTTINAYKKNAGVQVEWTAKTETAMDRYDVERQIDNGQWTTVNRQTAIGNSNSPLTYTWFDATPVVGNNYYRVKAFDRSGSVKYTAVVKVTITKGIASIKIYTNPVVGNTVQLQFNDVEKGNYAVSLINSIGQTLYQNKIVHDGGTGLKMITIPSVAPGNYKIVLVKEDGSKTTLDILKN